MMFSSTLLPEVFSKVFAPIPDVPIWQWADGGPFVLRKAPEPVYRSAKTPWTRRGADLLRRPWNDGRRIRRFGARKSSQSGYTEGVILNPIRWAARYKPVNCIISVDSQKEVGELRERLVPTLQDLGQSIFTDNTDDLSKFALRLLDMNIWFAGSFSPGGFSNKFAPWVFQDEVDLYGEITAEGNTIENYYSRTKKSDASGFQVVISKPAMAEGPIDSFFKRGNQEHWEVECPHHGCHARQVLDWEHVIFSHCKDLTGAWDYERVLNETFYRCKNCGQPIHHNQKDWMNARGLWIPTAKGDPEIITQQMNDLYSLDATATFGHLAKEFLTAVTTGNRTLLQAFRQQRLGLPWEEKMQKIETPDVLRLRAAYRRGVVPQPHCALVVAQDIGAYVNTRWEVFAFNTLGELWLIDWGVGEGPQSIISLLSEKRYPGPSGNLPITFAFLDARYRTDEVYETCLIAPSQIFPVMGIKSTTGARSISYVQVQQKPQGFGVLTFLDRDAKFDLYIDRIKEQKPPRIYFPENVDEVVVREHSAERLIQHKRTNQVIWEEDHKRPNHFGDCTKIAITAVDWMLKARRARILADAAAASQPEIAQPGAVESVPFSPV